MDDDAEIFFPFCQCLPKKQLELNTLTNRLLDNLCDVSCGTLQEIQPLFPSFPSFLRIPLEAQGGTPP